MSLNSYMILEAIFSEINQYFIDQLIIQLHNSITVVSQFKLWKEHHGKMYGSDEEHETRAKIWADNVKFIHEHNKKAKSYTVEMNHFGDMVSS